eukprot:114281_1
MSQRESRDKKRKRNAAYQSRSASPNTNNNNNTNKNIQSPLLKRQRSNNSNNVKYNSSHFQSNNFINKLQNRTNTNSSTNVNSTAATSPSSTTPPTPPKNCKDQKKISTLIPKTYKNYEKFKKIYNKKLNGDNMYQELQNKIIECNKQLKEYAKCCWDRKEFCQDIIISCGWDSCSCVMGKTKNLTQTQY